GSRGAGYRVADKAECSDLYSTPSRQSAYKMPASSLATATVAINLPRRSSMPIAQRLNGSLGRRRRRHQAACTSALRTWGGPALVIPVRLCLVELERSPGTNPRNDCTA